MISAIFQNAIYWYSSPYTNIGHTTGYILRFWVALLLKNRPSYGNLKFDLLFDLMTYLFDLWPQNNDMSMFGAILHMWTKIGDD